MTNLNEETWKPISFMDIKKDTYEISSYGRIKLISVDNIYEPEYHSTNGYDYSLFMTDDVIAKLYPIDLIVAKTFIPVPQELIETIKNGHDIFDVIHIDMNNRNNNVGNLKWIEMKEEWRIIIHDNVPRGSYSISNLCHIRNNNTGKLLSFNTTGSGYKRICLPPVKTKYRQSYSAHRLVAKAFVPGYTSEKNQVNHIDGNKTHNTPRNLEWMSNRENMDHAIATGLKKTVITDNDAVIISQELVNQDGNAKLVYDNLIDQIDNISYDIINNIKYKGSWAYISDKYFDDNYFNTRKYSDKDDIHKICISLVNHNGKVKEVIDELKNDIPSITKDVVGHIKFKQTWADISDQYFIKDQFRTVLIEDEVRKICELLIKYHGDKHKVYNSIVSEIPFITKDTIRAIRDKKNYKSISDKYFKKDQFK